MQKIFASIRGESYGCEEYDASRRRRRTSESPRVGAFEFAFGGVARVFISTPREFHRLGRRVRCYKNPRVTTGTRAATSNQSRTMTSPTSSERRAAARLARSSAARLEFGRSRSPLDAPPRRRPIGGALSRVPRAVSRRRAAARAAAFLGLDARDAPAPPPTHRPHTIKSLATRSSASSLSLSKSA